MNVARVDESAHAAQYRAFLASAAVTGLR